MSLASWIDKHPWMTFFLASSVIGGVVSIATAPFAAKAAPAPALPTAFAPGHRYQMQEPIGPNSTPNTVVQAQTAIDSQFGVGLFRVESIAQRGNILITTLVYTGTTPLPLGAVAGISSAGVKILDLGPA